MGEEKEIRTELGNTAITQTAREIRIENIGQEPISVYLSGPDMNHQVVLPAGDWKADKAHQPSGGKSE